MLGMRRLSWRLGMMGKCEYEGHDYGVMPNTEFNGEWVFYCRKCLDIRSRKKAIPI